MNEKASTFSCPFFINVTAVSFILLLQIRGDAHVRTSQNDLDRWDNRSWEYPPAGKPYTWGGNETVIKIICENVVQIIFNNSLFNTGPSKSASSFSVGAGTSCVTWEKRMTSKTSKERMAATSRAAEASPSSFAASLAIHPRRVKMSMNRKEVMIIIYTKLYSNKEN